MAKQPPPSTVNQLWSLTEELERTAPDLTEHRAKALRNQLAEVVAHLGRVMVSLDPVREPTSVFDPSAPSLVGKFAGLGLVAQDKHPIGAVPAFYGSGVYALYYHGSFEAYAPIAGSENPIYVGKADPQSTDAKTPREQGRKLSGRLKDHVRAIGKAKSTLSLHDFSCRFLVVQSGWQVAAESYLIELFKPIWNDEMGVCYGIGKHGDDPKTRANLRSPWDTLHPGRDWAHREPSMKDARPKEQIQAHLRAHFCAHEPHVTVDSILRRFYEDLKQR